MSRRTLAFGVVLATVAVGAICSAADGESQRPEKWADPISTNGVPNLHRVSETLYRSAQPSKEGMKTLHGMGVKTILNLRSFHSDRDEIGELPLHYEHLTVKAWHPEEKEVVHFLKLVAHKEKTPLLVHCQHGADRTGTICAIYRMALQGWSADDAIREMREGGFGFHEVWTNLEPWIRELDMERIKRLAGMSASEPQPTDSPKKPSTNP